MVATSWGKRAVIIGTALASLVRTYHVRIYSAVEVWEIWYIGHIGSSRVITWSPHQTVDLGVLWLRSKWPHINRLWHWCRGPSLLLLHKDVEKRIVLGDGQTSFTSTSVWLSHIVGSLRQHGFYVDSCYFCYILITILKRIALINYNLGI